MSLDEKFIPVRTTIYDVVSNLFKNVAGFFGYPDNPGMPTIYEMPSEVYARRSFLDSLPKHQSRTGTKMNGVFWGRWADSGGQLRQ